MTATLDRPVLADVGAPRHLRLGCLDALRGLAIGLMVFVNLRGSDAVPLQLRHSAWDGFTVADAVFPMFLFAVGAAMTLSSRTTELRPAAWRTVKLFAVGSLLSSLQRGDLPHPALGVLQHIAVASFLACLLLRLPPRRQVVVMVLGLAAMSIAGSVVGWGPPHAGGFTPEGPQSWLGSVASIWFGVVAGRIVTTSEGTARRLQLLGWSAWLLVTGVALGAFVPINKPMWTPSFALVGAGVACAVLAAVDVVPDAVTRPLRALGTNAIVTYVVAETALWGLRNVAGGLVPPLVFPSLALAVLLATAVVLDRRGVRVRL